MYKTIIPPIDLCLKPITNLAPSYRNMICSCKEPCINYVMIDGFGRYCEKDAKDIALGIISLVNGLDRITLKRKREQWTHEEDQYVIDWYERRGGTAEHGDHRIIADMLDRPLNNVKNRIKYMRQKGMI